MHAMLPGTNGSVFWASPQAHGACRINGIPPSRSVILASPQAQELLGEQWGFTFWFCDSGLASGIEMLREAKEGHLQIL